MKFQQTLNGQDNLTKTFLHTYHGIHTMELTWNPEINPQAKLRTRDENTDTDLRDLGFGHGS